MTVSPTDPAGGAALNAPESDAHHHLGAGTTGAQQLTLFGAVPQFEASPVGLLLRPHEAILAAVLFPLPVQHLGKPFRLQKCSALVLLTDRSLCMVSFPQAKAIDRDLWTRVVRQARQENYLIDHVVREGQTLLREISGIHAWPIDGYARTSQFDRLCDHWVRRSRPADATGNSCAAIALAVRAQLQLQLGQAVHALMSMALGGKEIDHFVSHQGLGMRVMTTLLKERCDITVNIWGDLQRLAALAPSPAIARIKQALLIWPVDMLRAATSTSSSALNGQLRLCLLEGNSVVRALAQAGVSRPVIRRVMRLGRHFPDLNARHFSGVLTMASRMPIDLIPATAEQWLKLTALRKEQLVLPTGPNDNVIRQRLLDWSWAGHPRDLQVCVLRAQAFKVMFNCIVGRTGPYSDPQRRELAELLLECPPSLLDKARKQSIEAMQAIRREATERAAHSAGLRNSVELLNQLLRHLPAVDAPASVAGVEFVVWPAACELIEHGKALDNCLAEPRMGVEYLLSGQVPIPIRTPSKASFGLVAVVLPRSATPNRAEVSDFQWCSKASEAGVRDAVTAFLGWFNDYALPKGNYGPFRLAIERARREIETQMNALNRIQILRDALSCRAPTRSTQWLPSRLS